MTESTKKRAAVERYSTKKTTFPKGKNYILAIAIDDYAHAPKLGNAVKDAEDIIAVLTERYSFEADNVIRCFDDAANKRQIFEAFEYLAANVKIIDNVLIYYAGHGYYNKANNTGYLVPQNEKDYWDYLSNADLKNLIRAIQSHHTFFIVDSCFSGSLFASNRVMPKSPDLSVAALAERVGQFSSRWCLAAGQIEEVADGQHGENSPFAQAVLSYLKTNTSGRFPASTLIQYVKRVTPNNADQTPIGGALLNTKDLGGEFIFELKKDEVADWQTALAVNDITAYKTFLEIHPDGQYATTAHARIKQLQRTAAWDAIEKTKDEQLWEAQSKILKIKQFIRKYEGSEQYFAAVALGRSLEIKARFIKAKSSYFDLLTFSKEDTPYKAEAMALLTKMDKEQARRGQEAEEIARKNRVEQEAIAIQKAKEQAERETEEIARKRRMEQETIAIQKAKEQAEREAVIKEHKVVLPQKVEEQEIIPADVDLAKPSPIKKYGILAGGLSFILIAFFMIRTCDITKNPLLNRLNEDMEFVQGGTFTMGCTKEQGTCMDEEKPAHKVTVKSFYIDRYEVTNEQYVAFLNAYGSDTVKSGPYVGQLMIEEIRIRNSEVREVKFGWRIKKSENQWTTQNGYEEHPVVNVSWYGANEYAQFYNMRLPSEAEWEFAARGGTKSKDYRYAGSNDFSKVGWSEKNFSDCQGTQKVGQKGSNELGLHDMTGNVWEWCMDTWHENYQGAPTDGSAWKGKDETKRMSRGGSFCTTLGLRVAERGEGADADERVLMLGFRVAR